MEPNENVGVEFPELIAKAKAGDTAALETLYRLYSPSVLAKLRGQLRPALRRRYDTEDLGQSVFAEVLRDLPQFESMAEGAFRKWLALKTRSKLFGKFRRHHTEFTLDGNCLVAPDGGDSAGERDDQEKLARAMETLDGEEREILRLRGEGLPYAELAARFGLPSADAARMRYSRALLRLKERWKQA